MSQTTKRKKAYQYEKCNECHKRRKPLEEGHKICHTCFKSNTIFKSSGNKTINDFIKYTQISYHDARGMMEFVPYERFKDVEYVTDGGFSKIYKAIWIDGPIKYFFNWNIKEQKFNRLVNRPVALKKLHTKELNEVLNEVLYITFNIYFIIFITN